MLFSEKLDRLIIGLNFPKLLEGIGSISFFLYSSLHVLKGRDRQSLGGRTRRIILGFHGFGL